MTDDLVQVVFCLEAAEVDDLGHAGVWAGDDGVDLDEGDDREGGSGQSDGRG